VQCLVGIQYKDYKAETIIENDFSDYDEIFVINLGDVHIGNPFFCKSLFEQTLEFIKSYPNIFVILSGDLLENITKHSVGNMFEQVISPMEQKYKIIEYLTPIKDRIIGITTGNHESRKSNIDSDTDLTLDIAQALDIPYNPYAIINFLSVGSDIKKKNRPVYYSIHTTHGSGSGSTITSSLNVALKPTKKISGINIFFNGHNHLKLVVEMHDRVFYSQSKTVRELDYYVVSTGSYIEYGGYAAKLNLPSKALGSIGVILSGKTHNIIPMDVSSAIEYFKNKA